jgi:LysR family transcriptional regulator, glycine cleavage system transcriptional activator
MPGLGKLIPSPRGLLIFEAAARAGTCSAAAREFNLTQPSVSRNIAQLEQHLGVLLFTRSPAGLELTPEGQFLYQALSDGLAKVETALRELIAERTRKQVVELSLSTAFVTHWLIPRLSEFHLAFPEVDLRFQLISGTLRGAPGNADLAMRMHATEHTGDHQSWADHHSWRFAPEIVIPVCSPSYAAAHGTLEAPMRESGHVLLHLADPLLDWDMFWGGVARRRTKRAIWLEFTDYAVVLQGAMNGEGIALGWITVVARALAEGKLVPASARRVRTGRDYHLFTPRAKPVRDVVLAIRDWMIAQMQLDMQRIAELLR